jgi:TP901 family phage tail tape measure protein
MPIQIPVTQTGLEASIIAAAKSAGRNLKLDLGPTSRAIGSLSQPLGKITGQADEFTKSMEAANARVLAFGASVGVLAAIGKGFKDIVSSTIQVEKSLADINSILGANTKQLGKFKDDIFSIARETGTSFETVSEAALELSRQGLQSDEVLRRLKDSMILTRLSGLDAASAVEGLTAAVNSFQSTGLTTSDVLNKISKTAAAYSVSERDLIEGFKRSASVAQQAGVTIDELGGIITAVQQKTARGGATIGNAFKTIFTRIQRPESLEALQDVGVAVTDLEGKILPATGLLQGLAVKLKDLSQIELSQLTEKIGGGFQIGPLLSALDDLTSKTSVFAGATKAMGSAGDEAYQRNTALNQTLETAINSTTVSLKELSNTLGELGVTDNLKNILSYFSSFIGYVKDLLKGEGIGNDFARGIVKGIGSVLAGPGLLIFGAIIAKLTYNFVQFGLVALKTFFNIGSAAKEIGTIQTSIANTLLTNKSIQTQILALEGNRVAQAEFFSVALRTQLATMEKIRGVAATVAPLVFAQTTGTGRATPRGAGGYMPSVMAESNDIRRGVGGAKPSDRPVVIPNFAFGGGKTGTMVANTGEHIVKNYGGSGGSAIFNRDMAKQGLPINAEQIRSAGGFIPNFVRDITGNKKTFTDDLIKTGNLNEQQKKLIALTRGGSTFDIRDPEKSTNALIAAAAKAGATEKDVKGLITIVANRQVVKSEKKQSGTLDLNADNLGGLGVVSITGPISDTITESITGTSFKGGAKEFVDKIFGKDVIDTVRMSNIQARTLSKLDEKISDNQKAFRGKVKERFVAPTYELAKDILPTVFKGNDKASFEQNLLKEKNDPALFSDSVLGGIFESAVKVATKSANNIGSFSDSDDQRPFDFEEGSSADEAFKSAFGFTKKPLFKADGKKTATSGTGKSISSIISKALRDSGTQTALLNKSLAGAAKKGAKRSASGYIPNFADAIYEAVSREIGAGVNPSQIYVDQNNSLKNPLNPSGLMIANRRDEPAGGFQGINRARREGASAQTYGAANGFVPNYADLTMESIGVKQSSPLKSNLGKLNDEIKRLNEEIAQTKISFDEAQKELAKYISELKGGKTGKTKITPNAAAAATTAATAQLNRPAPPEPKAPRDMLGTIFAVQAGMTLLAGATSDATSSLAKYTNIVSSGLSGITAASFAFQGFSQVAKDSTGGLGKLVGKLGMYGAVVGGLFEVFKLGKNIYLESSGANKMAAENTAKLAESAKKAAINLDELNPVRRQQVESKSANIFYNFENEQITKEGEYQKRDLLSKIVEGSSISFDRLSGEDLLNIKKSITTAVANGISEVEIGKILMANRGNLGQVTTQGSSKMQSQLLELAKNPPLKKLKEDLDLATNGDLSIFAKDYKIPVEDLKTLKDTPVDFKESNLEQRIAKGRVKKAIFNKTGIGGNNLEELIKKFQESGEVAKKEQDNFSKASSASYTKLLSNLAAEQSYREKISTIENNSNNSQIRLQGIISDIMNDQSLSEEDKAKAIKRVELSSKISLSNLDLQKQKLIDIKSLVEGLSKEGGLKISLGENIEASANLEASLLSQTQNLSLTKTKTLVNDTDLSGLEAIALKAITDAGIAGNQKALVEELVPKVREMLLSQIGITEQKERQNDLDGSALDNDERRINNANALTRAFEKVKAAADIKNLSKSLENISLKGQSDRVDIEKQAKLSDAKTFAGVTDPQKYLDIQQKIESDAFEKKRKLDLEIQVNQIKMEAERESITLENITALGQNTEAINNLIDAQAGVEANIAGEKSLYTNSYGSVISHNETIALEVKRQNLVSKFTDPSQNLKYLGSETATNENVTEFLKKLAYKESGFNPNKVYKENFLDNDKKNVLSMGLFQVSPESSRGYGFKDATGENLKNPEYNTKVAVGIMSQLLEKSKGIISGRSEDKYTGLAAYWSPFRKDANMSAAGQLGSDASRQVEVLSKLKPEEMQKAAQEFAEGLYGAGEQANKFAGMLSTKAGQITQAYASSEQDRETQRQKQQADKNAQAPKTFSPGIDAAFLDINTETQNFAFEMGKRIPQSFADNMAAAMDAVLVKGESLGDALRSAASSFLSQITQANLKNIANIVTGGIGQATGSLYRAAGGPITGGSGNKDDVPAMLMGGEFVMNKKAVQKYGMGFMSSINSGGIQKFAKGGYVIRERGEGSDLISNKGVKNQTAPDFYTPGLYGSGAISGKKNLLNFARQGYTSGAKDIISGGSNYASIDLSPESVRLTNFGRQNGPAAEATRTAKKEAFNLYLQQLSADKQAKEESKAEKEAFKKALIMAAITTVASAGIGAAGAGFRAGASSAGPNAGFLKTLGSGVKGIYSGGDIGGGIMAGGLKNIFTGNFGLSQVSSLREYQSYLNNNPKLAESLLAGANSKTINGPNGDYLNIYRNTQTRATGGQIPQTAGIDTVPAMLSGGEFIMNAAATQRIGQSNLNALNSGATTTGESSETNDKLLLKIDELIKITKESGKAVTVNVSSSGKESSPDQAQSSGQEQDKNLSRKIKAAVVQVLQEEKRLGGVLRRS